MGPKGFIVADELNAINWLVKNFLKIITKLLKSLYAIIISSNYQLGPLDDLILNLPIKNDEFQLLVNSHVVSGSTNSHMRKIVRIIIK